MVAPAYCTLSEVKAQLGIASADTTDDTRITAVIDGVSRAIEEFCGHRRFYTVTESRTYTAKRADRILIDDCVNVTKVETDNAGLRLYEWLWPSDQYDLLPDNAPLDGYPYWCIQVSPLGIYHFPTELTKGVRITGDFGYSTTVPEMIHQAALFQVALQFRAADAPLGVEGGGLIKSAVTAVGLHPFTKRLLWNFRKVPV